MTRKHVKPKVKHEDLIYVGIPRERFYMPAFVDNRDAILTELTKAGIACGYFQAEGHRVDRNRDRIVQEFLAHADKPDWLLMMDSDMQHPTEGPLRLRSWNKPIVGGLYFHRGQFHDPFVFEEAGVHKDNWGRDVLQWRPLRDEVFDFLDQNNIPMRDGGFILEQPVGNPLMECDAVATGNILIHRKVFEALPAPWFEYRSFGISEDLMFCYEAKKAGFPVFADLSTVSGHYNLVPMGQAQFRMLYRNRGINLTTFTKRDAISWLKDFFEIEEKEATLRIEKGNPHLVGDYWTKVFGDREVSPDEIREFYEKPEVGELYIIELLHWNFTAEYNRIRTVLDSIRGMNILEIGSGIGTATMQLAIQNNNVVAVDINETLRRFSDFRWQKFSDDFLSRRGVITWMGDEWREEINDGIIDAVVSMDTLEHLNIFDLVETIEQITRVLKPGGRFIFYNNWGQQDLYPMHQKNGGIFDESLTKNGLVRISSVEAMKPW